jgi:hypothetical protein
VREVLVVHEALTGGGYGADGAAQDEDSSEVLAELARVTGVPVVLLEAGQTLESLDAEQMRQAGWVRATNGD